LLSAIDVGERGFANVTPSVCESPNEQNSRISVSGVFRRIVTYPEPSHRSIGTGESRIVARKVPSTSAPSPEYAVSLIVTQNAAKISSRYSANMREISTATARD
jgi:hypothetical protein